MLVQDFYWQYPHKNHCGCATYMLSFALAAEYGVHILSSDAYTISI